MKFIAKVISDNGYKIELIRPLRDIPFSLGATVEITITPKQTDLINTFNNLLDDETKNMILDKFNEARRPVIDEQIKKVDAISTKTATVTNPEPVKTIYSKRK